MSGSLVGLEGELLAELLRRSAATPPDRLLDLMREVLEPAGFTAVDLFLVDQQCFWLLPFPGSGPDTPALATEGTRQGDAFRGQEPVVDGERVWLPVTETAERLGVLGVAPPGGVGATLDFCQDLARLTGQLLHTRSRYTDTFVTARRREPMELAAELQWSLLPPVAFSCSAASVAAAIEPAYDVGGDAFDYALDGELLHFVLFDAMGHGLEASLISALAVGAYRNGRRAGLPLPEVMQRVDDAILQHFGGDRFVTGHMGQLDTRTGRLTYVNAGHPPPLILRTDAQVEAPESPPRIPLGLGRDPVEERTVDLHPGDRLLLHSDGVVEGRDATGDAFGPDRLVRLLSDHPEARLSELAYLVVAASLAHQGGETRDDSTVLLVRRGAGR